MLRMRPGMIYVSIRFKSTHSPWGKARAFDSSLTPYGGESDAKQGPPAWAFDFQEQ